MRADRFEVSFRVSLMWEEAGGVRRASGCCVDLSTEGMRVEVRDRLAPGTVVLVTSVEFGRIGQATIRYYQRDRMRCFVGMRFRAALGLGDPARQKILAKVMRPKEPGSRVNA